MSDYDDYEDDSQDAGSAVQQLRKANKAKDKQLKELTEQLQSMQKSLRERSVKDVLAAKGLPEKVAAFIPDTATTSDEVEAWIAEYGDVFGIQQGQDAAQQPDPQLDAFQRISQVQSTGQPFTNDADQMASLIRSVSSPDELNKLLFGNAVGPQAS